MTYKEKIIQGVKCCIQQKKKCNECPFYNKCDKLREEVLHAFVVESYQYEDWSGFQEGF